MGLDDRHSIQGAAPDASDSGKDLVDDSIVDDYRARLSHVDEAKLMRKVDLRVVPVLTILYLLAFLDRVNISNAALFGLKTDLNLEGNEFNTALVVFFVPYVLFEIPSNVLLKRFRPHIWLSLCMFLFGLVSVLQGFTQNLSGLVATRFFLGLAEAGIFPACFYLMSMWYKRSESQKRFSFFFSSTTLAGGFGGLLASAIGKMDGLQGFRGWRWVFILEGVLTCVVSVFLYLTIPDFPEEVTWLSKDEKDFVKARLYEDVGDPRRQEPLTIKIVLDIFKDYKIIVGGFMYFGLIVPAYGYAYFTPTIIQSLGHGSIQSQLLSVPQWAVAFVVAMASAAASDKLQHRFLFAVMLSVISLVGFIILRIVHDNAHLQYGALFLASMGMYSAMPIVICWFSANLGGHHRRAVGTAWQIGFGNIGGIIATFSFLAKDAPKYIPGYSICIAFLCVSIVADIAYFFGINIENKKRAAHVDNTLALEDKKRMGDLNPDYRYLL
ncbi:MFS general substrate transporter [Obba rivulosa]|uniref:MFS general substrate transporter n=1 Tax=Obba rivulosa TaxID=1052685 RepID=A0A8E2ASN2_9APHY|nr:MFS general substrate transporter [Obba rivulosa]